MAGMSIPFVSDDAVQYGTAIPVDPGLTRVVAGNAGSFTYTGSGSYLIGERSLTVVDPGPNLESHFEALLAAIDGRPVERILITHRHRDHAGLANHLREATSAPIAAHPVANTKSNFGAFKTGLMDESMVGDLIVDQPLADGTQIACDGADLEVIFTPGHTSDHCCLYWADRKTVFTGDHVMGWSTTVIAPPEGDMTAYMAGLRRVAALEPERLIPTHGVPVMPGLPFLEALIAHREMREAQVLTALRERPQTVSEMVTKLYPDLAPALVPAAGLSLLGHLDALIGRGDVTLEGTDPLDHPFQLT